MEGSCKGCPSSAVTLRHAIEEGGPELRARLEEARAFREEITS